MLVSSFPLIDLFLQFLLALVFAGAAVPKLQNADEFHGVVRNFRLLPEAVDGAFAAALPWVELGIAASLILGVGIPASGALAGLLLFVFAFAIAINIFRGRTEIDCGCFRQGMRQPLSWTLVLRNTVLGAGAFWLAAQPAWSQGVRVQDFVIAALAATSVALIYLCANELSALRRLPLGKRTVKDI
jgi:uncharacterized membrane protein YphA (DoxX/SURF4 family)